MLTSIAGVSKVYAYFDGSEQTYLRLQGAPTAARKAPKVRMGLANEQGFPHDGEVDFVDNRLNPQTGAIRMRASLRQRQAAASRPAWRRGCAWKGRAPYDAVLVPDRAIGTDQTKKFVYVVGADRPAAVPRGQARARCIDGMRVVAGTSRRASTSSSTACSASCPACRSRRRC